MWTFHSRTGYEAAILRASRELVTAARHAGHAGDEAAYDAIGTAHMQLLVLRSASIEGKDRPAPPKQLKGQTSLTEAPWATPR